MRGWRELIKVLSERTVKMSLSAGWQSPRVIDSTVLIMWLVRLDSSDSRCNDSRIGAEWASRGDPHIIRADTFWTCQASLTVKERLMQISHYNSPADFLSMRHKRVEEAVLWGTELLWLIHQSGHDISLHYQYVHRRSNTGLRSLTECARVILHPPTSSAKLDGNLLPCAWKTINWLLLGLITSWCSSQKFLVWW